VSKVHKVDIYTGDILTVLNVMVNVNDRCKVYYYE